MDIRIDKVIPTKGGANGLMFPPKLILIEQNLNRLALDYTFMGKDLAARAISQQQYDATMKTLEQDVLRVFKEYAETRLG